MRKLFYFFSLLIFANSLIAHKIDSFYIMAENWPPYQLVNKGKLYGLSVDVLEEILKRIDSKLTRKDFHPSDWASAYNSTQKLKGRMLFSAAKTKAREGKFKWVGPIASNTAGLIAKKSKDIKILSDDDLKKYKIGTVKNNASFQILKNKGLSKENFVFSKKLQYRHNLVRMLEKSQIDLLETGNINFTFRIIDSMGYNKNDYELVYKVKEYDLYFMFNKKTDQSIIDDMQIALDNMKKDGTYEKIISKYKKFK